MFKSKSLFLGNAKYGEIPSEKNHLFGDDITFSIFLKKFFWGSLRWEPPRWGHTHSHIKLTRVAFKIVKRFLPVTLIS